MANCGCELAVVGDELLLFVIVVWFICCLAELDMAHDDDDVEDDDDDDDEDDDDAVGVDRLDELIGIYWTFDVLLAEDGCCIELVSVAISFAVLFAIKFICNLICPSIWIYLVLTKKKKG